MPENAAAEGGYGLSASEAFGGGVGSNDSAPSPSAVGGTFGGFGEPGLPGSAPAQSGRYGRGTPTPGTDLSNALAQAQFAVNSRVQAANKAAAIAQSKSFSSKQAAAKAQEAMALKGRTSLGLPSLSRNTPTTSQSFLSAIIGRPATNTTAQTNTVAQTNTTAPTPYSEKSLVGRIAQDISMGLTNPFASRETQTQSLLDRGYSQAEIDSYFDRTDATMARNQEMQDNAPGARDEVVLEEEDGTFEQDDTLGPRPNNPAMLYRRMLAERFGGMAPQGGAQQAGIAGISPFFPGTPMPSGQMPGNPNALTIVQPPQVTPEMRREALRIFESQRGAGQIPYQMLPYQQGLGSMPPQNLSPAFQYAAQNYQRLGGSQRLMDRPMEMMSVAERQRINEMAQGMAGMQRPTTFSGKGSEIAGGGDPNFTAEQSDVLRRIMPLISQMSAGRRIA